MATRTRARRVQVDEIVRDASQLRAFIKDTEDVININLDRYMAPHRMPSPGSLPPAARGLSRGFCSYR
jgi:hypothetical protein